MSHDPATHPVSLTVNARTVSLAIDERTPLVHVLRNDLSLKGVRTGCSIGECGVCTVEVDGQAVRSCTVALGDVAGGAIVTAEGLGTPEAPGHVQQAFLAEQAAQCGYCINGMIMRTHIALARGATADEVVDELEEHLCRCGAHGRIVRAVMRAAGQAVDPPPGCLVAREEVPPTAAGSPPLGVPVSNWLRGRLDGRVELRLGKVELGQGIRTALSQVAASSAGLRLSDLVLVDVETGTSPDEGYTAASRSLMQGGVDLAWAGTAFRRQLRRRAAERLGCDLASVDVRGGQVHVEGVETDRSLPSLADLLDGGPLDGGIDESDAPSWDHHPLGVSAPREDLRTKLTGAAAYLQDMELPDMIHARAVLPPGQRAHLADVDVAACLRTPGLVSVVRDGDLLLVLAADEAHAVAGARRLAEAATWDDPGLDIDSTDTAQELRRRPSEPLVARRDVGVATALGAGTSVGATFTIPYQLHAPVAPSCAVARWQPSGTLEIWSHSQGPYPLRSELAALFGLADDEVIVRHRAGAGCYGHNMADDAAGLAAMAARAVPGRWVRLGLGVEDEFTWEPQSSAMLMDLRASVDDGRVRGWSHRAITDTHLARPIGTGDRLMVSWLREGHGVRTWPGPHPGGARNAVPLYDFPHLEAVADHVDGPVRTSALRTLGAFANAFASESFMDEVAETAGEDPVAFRLSHLTDPRARAVLEAAADTAGWRRRVGPTGYGQGVALTRYKGEAAYVALVVECAIDETTRALSVRRVVVACDAGVVVNPDGLRNQIEGGVVQGIGRTLFEAVLMDSRGQHSRDWTGYPVLRFSDVPEIQVLLLDRPGHPPLGVGEATTPAVPGAVANAMDDLTGIRMRALPITPSAIEARLWALDDREAARVIA